MGTTEEYIYKEKKEKMLLMGFVFNGEVWKPESQMNVALLQ